MTHLAGTVLSLLVDERKMPPLAAASIARVLWCVGTGTKGRPYTEGEVECALIELMAAGSVERVHSIRVGERYRIAHSVQVVKPPLSARHI